MSAQDTEETFAATPVGRRGGSGSSLYAEEAQPEEGGLLARWPKRLASTRASTYNRAEAGVRPLAEPGSRRIRAKT
jgi:hypothetical protein